MASDLKNLTGKVEKLSIGPVYDTNWSDMPDDIKLECIGKMDLYERLSLRCTAKAERSLVDSQKINFNKGRFWRYDRDLGFELFRDNKFHFYKNSEDINKVSELIKYIGKIGVIENLIITYQGSSTDNDQFMTDDGFFTAKKVEFKRCNTDNMVAVLRKLKNSVQSIKFDFDGRIDYPFDEILATSQVQSVPYWHIRLYPRTDSLHKIAQMWIDKNTKIGSIFQVSVFLDMGSFEEFLEHFNDRILSKSEKRVRVSTDNPDHHILLERGLDDVITIHFLDQYFRMMVISAEMKESEYDDNCRKWICKINPNLQEFVYDD